LLGYILALPHPLYATFILHHCLVAPRNTYGRRMCKEDQDFLLSLESSPLSNSLMVKIDKTPSCNTERRRNKRKGRKKTLITVVSDWGLDEIPKANNVVVFNILASVLIQSGVTTLYITSVPGGVGSRNLQVFPIPHSFW
jgi:hypothetical protein